MTRKLILELSDIDDAEYVVIANRVWQAVALTRPHSNWRLRHDGDEKLTRALNEGWDRDLPAQRWE